MNPGITTGICGPFGGKNMFQPGSHSPSLRILTLGCPSIAGSRSPSALPPVEKAAETSPRSPSVCSWEMLDFDAEAPGSAWQLGRAWLPHPVGFTIQL